LPDRAFAYVAYRLRDRLLALATAIESFDMHNGVALERRIGEADVLVISGLRRNDLLPRAKRLRFIQSIGTADQFSARRCQRYQSRSVNDQTLKDRRVKRGSSGAHPWKLTEH
jgi:hypothetical protein